MDQLLALQETILKDFEKEAFYQRLVFQKIKCHNSITGIVGPRGVGKTTFLLQTVLSNGARQGKALYVSADNIYFLKNKLFDLAVELYGKTDIRLLCIDEIQKYENWQQELKNIADSFQHLCILFTGSSMIDLIRGKYDLSRRVTLHHLHGFSFREFLEFYHAIKLPTFSIENILKNHSSIIREFKIDQPLKFFNEYLKIGYYPFFKNLSTDFEKYQALENATQKTIYEDISLFHSLKTPTLLIIEKLYKYVLNSLPGEMSIYKLASTIGKDYENVSEYFHYLEQAGLIRFLFANKSGKAQLRNPQKLYPENCNLIFASQLPLIEDSLKGKLRETFILNQLQNINTKVYYTENGDFKLNDITFEIGGRNKSNQQIKNIKNSYLLLDDMPIGFSNKIPLYLLGFLY